MGLAFFWVFLKFDQWTGFTTFGTVTSLVIGFSVLFLAYGTRAMNAAILQIHTDLEEAAEVSGAPPWRTTRSRANWPAEGSARRPRRARREPWAWAGRTKRRSRSSAARA